MAIGGKITIAEVEDQLEVGEDSGPNFIHTPGIYVHRIFKGEQYRKRIGSKELLSERII